MFICEKHNSCCDHKYWDRMEDVEQEAKECGHLIDVEPVRHGRWEEKFFTNDRQRVCSVCHCTVRQPSYDKGETALFNYCPHCGAKMDGERRESDATD